jgi:hypothetical protein
MRTVVFIRTFILMFAFASLLAPALVLADGTQTYSTPGTYTFIVPSYTGSLKVIVSGGGGGGGGSDCSKSVGNPDAAGGTGGASSFGSVIANGGTGGEAGANDACYLGYSGGGGSPGAASGGDVNITGGGATGGTGSAAKTGHDDSGGAIFLGGSGGNGGNGAAAQKTFAHGALTSGSSVTVVVGKAGAAGPAIQPGAPYGNAGTGGQGGSVSITWTPDGSPACSVTFDENPLTDPSTTIHWTSSGATLFYINGIGYVGATGSAAVFSAGDYSGTVTGPGGKGSCAALLQNQSGGLCRDGSPAPNGDTNQCTCAHGNQNACQNLCPTGQIWNGTQCVPGCETGYLLQNGECVFDQCPLNYTQSADQNGNPICVFDQCPVGYLLENGQCVFQSCPVGYMQQGTQCVFSGCPSGYTKQGNFCVPVTIQAPAADIVAVPSLVKQGQRSNISWSATGVSACAIAGTNGDSWSCVGAACNATTTERSEAIQAQTIYSLSCTGLDSSSLNQSVTIGVVPNFCETGAPGCN